MMLVRIFSGIVGCIIIFTIYGLFKIKDQVVNLHYQLAGVLKQLSNEKDTLHLLKVEQSYLSSPSRLRKLSSLYLQLETIKVKQMVSNPLVAEDRKYVRSNETKDLFFSKSTTKWRYKTIANNKYIKTVSTRKE